MMKLQNLLNVCFRFLAFASGLIFLASFSTAAEAQGNDCTAEYEGIEFCAHDGGNVRVVKIDLTNSNVRFEMAMAAYPLGNDQWHECTDVNVPKYAVDGRGCAFPNASTFPSQRVEDMVKRYPGAVAAINGDYFGTPNYDHGPEGLTVKNGIRFDGWAFGDCDGNSQDVNGKTFKLKQPTPCQGNDVNRPALKISKSNRVELGTQTWQDAQNDANYAARFWTVVSGGPMLVENGIAKSNQEACGTRWPRLDNPASSKLGDCERSFQSAVGVTRDGKTLLLAFVNRHDAEWTAKFLHNAYAAFTVMKLDGGGSTQIWYDGQAFSNDEGARPVTNALFVFAPKRGPVVPPQVGDWREQIARWFQDRQRDGQRWLSDRQRDAQTWMNDRQRDAQTWVNDRVTDAQRWIDEQIRQAQKQAEKEIARQLASLCSAQMFALGGVVWAIKRRARNL